MGLDFSHCDARWAYSGFAMFRRRLAEEIGFDNYDTVTTTNDPRFEKIKDDPIIYLLSHSDCDGHLTPKQCASVAPRLRELVKNWSDEDHDKKQALKLADGMELAAENDEHLNFC